jgi:DNA-binding HxlR family transcriptional regulator
MLPMRKERKMQGPEHQLSLHRATALLGRPWTLLIINALAKSSPCRFSELARRLPGISTNLLTERLRQLQAFEIVERDTGSMPQFVITYRLTKLGAQLEPIIGELAGWASRLPESPSR